MIWTLAYSGYRPGGSSGEPPPLQATCTGLAYVAWIVAHARTTGAYENVVFGVLDAFAYEYFGTPRYA